MRNMLIIVKLNLLLYFFNSNTVYAACILEGAMCQKLNVDVLSCTHNKNFNGLAANQISDGNSSKSDHGYQFMIKAKITHSEGVECNNSKIKTNEASRVLNDIINITFHSEKLSFCSNLKNKESFVVHQTCCDVIGGNSWCGDFEIDILSIN